MGNSFQDQLLKAGLVNKKQVKKAKHEKRVKRKKKKGAQVAVEQTAPKESQARQEQLAQEERNRELNRQRNLEKQKREQEAQIRQLIQENPVTLDEHGEPYYFAHENRVKKVYASEAQIKQLSKGQLAIVQLDDFYQVIPGHVAEQIAKRDREALIVFHDEKE